MNNHTSAPVVLHLERLTKRYGSLAAVKDLTIDIHEGEILGLLGPNGAGKTTTISMICGLLKPDGGEVSFGGNVISNRNGEFRARVGLCPQNNILWERLTCLEQMLFMGEMYGLNPGTARRRSEQLLNDMGLAEKRNKQARTLSGGMQRRLNLLMALVHDPQLVVLDEPEAGLDPQSRAMVREYIRSLARMKTVILTTHNMDEAERVADRVAIMDHGELLVLDTPERLKEVVGPGDVVEIQLRDAGQQAGEQVGRLSTTLADLAGEVSFDPFNQVLRVRALHAAGRLPHILDSISETGLTAGDVSIRANTLEDVFLQLTGRRLRE